MPTKRESELLSALPKDMAKTLAPALVANASPKRASAAFEKVLRALDYPVTDEFTVGKLSEPTDGRWRGVMPLPASLTPEQRAVAELLAYRDNVALYYFDKGDWQLFQMPETAPNRRRWLGIDPPGPLEAEITIKGKGKARTEPAWLALQRMVAGGTVEAKKAMASLPISARLELLGGLAPVAYGLGDMLAWLPQIFSHDGITKTDQAVARELAERLLKISARESRSLRLVVFPALVRSGVKLDARYDLLLPLEPNPNRWRGYESVIRESIAAIPERRREAAVMAALTAEVPDDRTAICRTMLEELPYAGVARIALEGTFARDLPKLVARLEQLGKKHPAIRDVLKAYEGASKAPAELLTCGPSLAPKSASELTPLQRKQLEAFGKAYDGRTLTASKRLSTRGGVDDGSFTRFLEIVEVFAKGRKRARYEAFLLLDSGSIFEQGTTNEIAAIIQGSVDRCKDAALLDALNKALFARKQRRARSTRR